MKEVWRIPEASNVISIKVSAIYVAVTGILSLAKLHLLFCSGCCWLLLLLFFKVIFFYS